MTAVVTSVAQTDPRKYPISPIETASMIGVRIRISLSAESLKAASSMTPPVSRNSRSGYARLACSARPRAAAATRTTAASLSASSKSNITLMPVTVPALLTRRSTRSGSDMIRPRTRTRSAFGSVAAPRTMSWTTISSPLAKESWKFVTESTRVAFGSCHDSAVSASTAASVSRLAMPPWRGVMAISTLSAFVNVRCSDSNASSSGFSLLKNIR